LLYEVVGGRGPVFGLAKMAIFSIMKKEKERGAGRALEK